MKYLKLDFLCFLVYICINEEANLYVNFVNRESS